jgi:hypothetical protein
MLAHGVLKHLDAIKHVLPGEAFGFCGNAGLKLVADSGAND